MSDRPQYPTGGSNEPPGWPPSQQPQGWPLPPAAAPSSGQPRPQNGQGYWGPQNQQPGYAPNFGPGTAGRDPRLPFGAQPPPQASIEDYRPPRNQRPLVLTILAIAVVAALVLVGTLLALRPSKAKPGATATPSSSVTDNPSADATTNGVTFENTYDDAKGYWQILDVQWQGDMAVITMTLRVDSGRQPLGFFVLNNETDRDYNPTASSSPDDMSSGTVEQGQTRTGKVTFTMPHGKSTIYLTDSSGRQVTALTVPA